MNHQNHEPKTINHAPVLAAELFADLAIDIGLEPLRLGEEDDPRDAILESSELGLKAIDKVKLGFFASIKVNRLVKRARKQAKGYVGAKSLHEAHMALGKALMDSGKALAMVKDKHIADLPVIVKRDPALIRGPVCYRRDIETKIFELSALKASMIASSELDAIVESIKFNKIESVKLLLLEMVAKTAFIRLYKVAGDPDKALVALGLLFFLTGKIGEMAEKRQQKLRRIHAV